MFHFCADELAIFWHLMSICGHCRDYAVILWRIHQAKFAK